MKKNRILTLLIIDDDRLLCDSIKRFFVGEKHHVFTAHSAAEGLAICSKYKIDIVLLDQKLPDAEGYTLCPTILKYNEQCKVIFITAYSSFENALKAIKAGAHDYLQKPFELDQLEIVINNTSRTLQLEDIEDFQSYQHQKQSEEAILIGNHETFREVNRLIDLAAKSEFPVLITGDTGTGKTVIAKRIHFLSNRRDEPFIGLNCNSLPDHLFEAELFGFEKGAFTDAQRSRKGIFAMAANGTLLLDEIGCMPIHLQSKLLSVLDEKKFRKLGGESFISMSARIIAATNADLSKSIKENKFREDLFYRLNVIRFHLPPLRRRLTDIPLLCKYFISNMGLRKHVVIPDSEYPKLMKYQWPGNIRELRNILERAVILQEGDNIFPSQLLQAPQNLSEPVSLGCAPESPQDILPLSITEQRQIERALQLFSGNLTQSAKALDISLSTLKRKIKSYGFRIDRSN